MEELNAIKSELNAIKSKLKTCKSYKQRKKIPTRDGYS